MNAIVTVSDIDGTLTAEDTILAFFDRFGKRQRAEQLWQWSMDEPERIEREFGIPAARAYPSMDVELVWKEVLEEKGPVALSAFSETARRAELCLGAEKFIANAAGLGPVFLLSAMFQPQAEAFATRFGLSQENAFATPLQNGNGFATGFLGPVREGAVKAKALDDMAARTGVPLSRFVGIGDSKSDADFIGRIVKAGGLGLAVRKDERLLKTGAVFVDNLWQAIQRMQNFAKSG